MVEVVFIPDDQHNPTQPTATTAGSIHKASNCGIVKQESRSKRSNPKVMPTTIIDDEKMGTNGSSGKDPVISGVPYYDDGGTDRGTEDQEESIREILFAMRMEFMTMGRKVESVEGKLGDTHNKMEKLSGKLCEAEI